MACSCGRSRSAQLYTYTGPDGVAHTGLTLAQAGAMQRDNGFVGAIRPA